MTGRLNLGGESEKVVVITTAVRLSKALNPNCYSGAAQWLAGQSVVVIGGFQV